MKIRYPNNSIAQVACALPLLLLLLVSIAGCKRASVNPALIGGPGASKPVRVSAPDMDGAEPAIASAQDGSVYAVWVNHTPNAQADVMLARFDKNGQMQDSAVRVNQQPGVATAWRGDPPTIVVAPDQTVFVAWTARVDSGHGTNLYLSSSSDRGRTVSAAVKVNDDTKPGVHGMHSLAVANDGHLYLAWLDERNITPVANNDMKKDASGGHHMESNRELFVASSTDGGKTFSPNQRVATGVCPCCKTSLAMSADGRLYLSWRQVLPGDFRHIAVASSTDAAKTFSQPVIVSDDQWMIKGCPVSGASLSAGPNGLLRVVWYAAGEKGAHGIYWSESHDGGQTFSPRQMLAATNAFGTPVLLGSEKSGPVAVWESNEKGTARLWTARLPLTASTGVNQVEIGNGELPAVSVTPERIFTLYQLKDNDRPAIWLVTIPATNIPSQ